MNEEASRENHEERDRKTSLWIFSIINLYFMDFPFELHSASYTNIHTQYQSNASFN